MGSRGSVIPYFLSLKKEGILNITHPDMTRFNITLDEGVDFVLQCFAKMWGGELFVPKIPSYNILDVIKAIDPTIKHEIVGIRPGEKLHEEMITTTDSMNTIEFKDYFVILPSVSLWDVEKFRNEGNSTPGEYYKFGFSYNSSTNKHFLSINELEHLINEHILV